MKGGFLYIMASRTGTLYVGVTTELIERACAHAEGVGSAFTRRYRCNRLVYYEEFPTILDAIAREKQIKKWRREKKETLIGAMNPRWIDLLPCLAK